MTLAFLRVFWWNKLNFNCTIHGRSLRRWKMHFQKYQKVMMMRRRRMRTAATTTTMGHLRPLGLFLSSSATFRWFIFPDLYTWMIFLKPRWKYFYQRVHSTLDQRLTLDPWGPISPRSPSLPIFPYKINSIFIRRHLLVLALALQKVDSTAQLVSLILSRWTAILATSSSGPIRSKGG